MSIESEMLSALGDLYSEIELATLRSDVSNIRVTQALLVVNGKTHATMIMSNKRRHAMLSLDADNFNRRQGPVLLYRKSIAPAGSSLEFLFEKLYTSKKPAISRVPTVSKQDIVDDVGFWLTDGIPS